MQDEEKKPLNEAEKVIVLQMQKWPSLYHDEEDVFLSCLIGGESDCSWKNGTLVWPPNQQYLGRDAKGKEKWGEYPIRISEDTARSLMHSDDRHFHTVHVRDFGDSAPMDCLPDDLHPDWQQFLSTRLYSDERITPDFYKTLVEAHCISAHGMRENPNAHYDSYISDWETYWKRIPLYRARLDQIRQIQNPQERRPSPVYKVVEVSMVMQDSVADALLEALKKCRSGYTGHVVLSSNVRAATPEEAKKAKA